MSDGIESAEAGRAEAQPTDATTAAGMVRINRTELVWPGKYDERGRLRQAPRVGLPFQVIERVNESRATREARIAPQQGLFDLFDAKEGLTFEEGWRNKLIWGDNLLVMGSLLDRFSGKVDLIYIDPPFASGADFTFEAEIGESDESAPKDRSALEEKAYRDTWGGGVASYLSMLRGRIELMRDLLSPTGSLYVHLDATVGHFVKPVIDEIFGPGSFQREIIWRIGWISGYKSIAKNWIRNHDTILYYVKTPGDFTFNKTYVPYPAGYVRRGETEASGKGYPIEDVWNANEFEAALTGADSLDSIQIKSLSREKSGYPTQKNESVVRRIVEASSNPGDLVSDVFCGSGTTLAVAEKTGRRWIGADLSRFGIHVSRKRLLDIPDCRPFEVLNLGRYERQYWQGIAFTDGAKPAHEEALFQYLAFILRLYGAQPVPGLTHVHGKRGRAFVHIGSVDAPVTIDEVTATLDECAALKQRELHVLGWEWEMGMVGPEDGGLIQRIAKDKGIKLSLLQIPREVMEQQAVARGDVKFFELAYLEFDVQQPKKLTTRIRLKDFVIPPDTEWIPGAVRAKVRKWSDYVDYWAVDWDFKDDTFIQGWVNYRTRNDRSLTLESDAHVYDRPGRHTILVKVVDIFGNDTSQAREVDVR